MSSKGQYILIQKRMSTNTCSLGKSKQYMLSSENWNRMILNRISNTTYFML